MNNSNEYRIATSAAVICSAILAVVFTAMPVLGLYNSSDNSGVASCPGVCISIQDMKSDPILEHLDVPEFLCTPEAVSEPLEAPVSAVNSSVEYYDVPLDNAVQDHIFALCEGSEIDPSIVVAMISVESTYKADAIGDRGRAFGLMQIQPRWHKERIEQLGVTDLLDPYQNITVGFNFLHELYVHYESIDTAMAVYNGGPKAADDEDNTYVAKVKKALEGLRRGEHAR